MFFYKEKNKDIRAAAYLRLSIEDGDKAESNSIGNQRELIRDFAAERPGLHLVEEYADDGYTGTNFERPGFKRMMEDSRKTKLGRVEWNPGTLAGVLANERHCGDVLARKTFTPNFLTHKSKKNNNDRTQYRQKNHHEAIVSREVFNAANHLRASRNYSKKNRPFEAHKELVPMQPGDVPVTYADTSALERDFGYKPSTSLREGLRKFAEWYAKFYK